LHTSKNETVLLFENLTVEHLLPQQGGMSDYPYASLIPVVADETPEVRRSFVKNACSSLCPESRAASGAQFERVFLSTARASAPL
jgi:hypothetical protein